MARLPFATYPHLLAMQQEIIRWYRRHKRDLPWRNTTPWGVMVSEFMLQQTPVSRVIPIWNQWMARWPTPEALAQASRSEVIRAWGNLGYPRRGTRLHETSLQITKKHSGKVPDQIAELRDLPGIGEYTAAAIVAFAFEKKSLVLDTNIRRLFSRAIDGIENAPLHITSAEKSNRAALIPRNAAIWAAATMELGALVCTAKNPKCEACPIAKNCRWKQLGFPTSKIAKKKQEWHGSNRQCRGIIMKELRAREQTTKSKLKKLWPQHSQLEEALQSLLTDGLIQKDSRSYKLVD